MANENDKTAHRVSPAGLHALPERDAAAVIVKRFPWMKSHAPTLAKLLKWQSGMEPKPHSYFRWHLPRLFTLMELLKPHIKPDTRILDISAYIPFSVAMQRQLPAEWQRTTYDAGIESFVEDGQKTSVASIALDCESESWPLPADHYNVAIFSEVVEHLHRHPQLALTQIHRALAPGGLLLLTTPNVGSWKKARMLTDGDWDYDSPSFSNAWGHRYEYSYYQLHCLLEASGFTPLQRVTKDIYFDDPRGLAYRIEMGCICIGKLLTGRWKKAASFYLRGGSGLFFVYQKSGTPSTTLTRI